MYLYIMLNIAYISNRIKSVKTYIKCSYVCNFDLISKTIQIYASGLNSIFEEARIC